MSARRSRGAAAGNASLTARRALPWTHLPQRDGLAGAAGRRGGRPAARSGAPPLVAPGHGRGAARRPGRRLAAAPGWIEAAGVHASASPDARGGAAAAARRGCRESAGALGRALCPAAPRVGGSARDARVLGELRECVKGLGPEGLCK